MCVGGGGGGLGDWGQSDSLRCTYYIQDLLHIPASVFNFANY